MFICIRTFAFIHALPSDKMSIKTSFRFSFRQSICKLLLSLIVSDCLEWRIDTFV